MRSDRQNSIDSALSDYCAIVVFLSMFFLAIASHPITDAKSVQHLDEQIERRLKKESKGAKKRTVFEPKSLVCPEELHGLAQCTRNGTTITQRCEKLLLPPAKLGNSSTLDRAQCKD